MSLPPPPIREQNQNSQVWQTWYRKISEFLSTNSFPWSFVSKAGSSLADIETRPHSALQIVLGSGSHHLSETQHTDLTDGGSSTLHYHATDRDRANHTGTQTLSTISDAGNSAGLDVGTTAGTVAAGDDSRFLEPPTEKIGDVAGGDYSEFEADGTLVFNGAATTWQDIDFPIIIRTTGANIPTLTILQGNVSAPQWAVNDYSVCEGQELVHQWKEGSEFQWHVHMITNGLDATERFVKWEIEWFWASPNGQISATITDTAEVSIPANTPDKTMIIREVALSTIAATIGGHIWARLRRIASTGTAPTNNPWCTMLQIHIECDTVGSRNRTTK